MTSKREISGRKEDGRFAPGHSGNPKGKPKGALHKTTLAAQALLEGEAEALTRKAIEKALEGDMMALRLCLERILPARKDRSISVALPSMETTGDGPKAMAAVMLAVASGEITPTEGATLAGMVETQRRAIETEELEKRVAVLERNQGAKR